MRSKEVNFQYKKAKKKEKKGGGVVLEMFLKFKVF